MRSIWSDASCTTRTDAVCVLSLFSDSDQLRGPFEVRATRAQPSVAGIEEGDMRFCRRWVSRWATCFSRKGCNLSDNGSGN